MSLRRALAALLITLAAAAVPAEATAKPSRKKAIWGPVQVDGKSQFPVYRKLGVGIYQYKVAWNDVALERPTNPRDPTDPAYRWPADLDLAAREAARHRIRLSLMVMHTPEWANGGQPANVPPTRARDYADFLEAVAQRYPSVRLWTIWGEPIRFPNFLVHFKNKRQRENNSPLNAVQRKDVQRYAVILDAAYGRLKRLSRRNQVIGGNTTTNGDFFGPFQWIKNLRLPNGKPPRMDMYGHNPFGTREPDLRKRQLLPGTADFSDLDVLVRWLDRYLQRGRRNRRLPVFISEFTAPTDVPSYEFNYHVTRRTQARWLASAFRIARRWPRIYTLGWIGLIDVPPQADGEESRTGLITRSGTRKPAFDAFRRG